MKKYASAGLTYDVAADEDLAALDQAPAFAAIQQQMQENRKPIERAELACTLPTADLMPEDLAYIPAQRSFFVSSVQHHSLYRVSLPKRIGGRCKLKKVSLREQHMRWPTLAVSWDDRRKLLWISTAALPGFTAFPKAEAGRSQLFAVDLQSRAIVRAFAVAGDSGAVLGDMSIAADGTLYVTDSIGGGVYRLAPGGLEHASLERLADGMFSPQTPVLTGDGRRLLVADYSVGIAVVELAAKGAALAKVEYLKHPDDIAVTGLDGLALDGDSLIGIQNGVDPERIIRFRLNGTQTEITSAEVIEQKTERLGEATHVIEVDGWYYVIANVGWDKIQDNGELKPGKQFTAPMLLRLRAR